MKIRKIICALVSLALLLGTLGLSVPVSAADNPGYFIEGAVSGDSFTVSVYLENCEAYSGRLALSYDTDILSLVDGGSFARTVKQSSYAQVTTEQNAQSVLLGNGRVMFAWVSQSDYGLDARSSKKEIAQITFSLANNASEEDFNCNTVRLYYVNPTMVYGWNCSAAVITTGLTAYRNNAADEDYLCEVDFDYPGCDYVPPSVYNASVKVTGTSGNSISASVAVDDAQQYTDMGGHVDFKLLDGVYSYRISASGYETREGYFIIDGKDEVFTVQLRSNAELAQYVADNIKIGFVDGDYAESVTANVTLPTAYEYGSISWVSSDSGVLSTSGVINRQYDDTVVTLTAYVRVGNESATKDFDVIVKSRYTAEEKNAMMAASDKAALEIGYSPGDSAQSVTVKLTLPETGSYGSRISWESSNEDIIDASGNVTRPESTTAVTLTADIIRGTAVTSKEFTVYVKGSPIPSEGPQSTDTPVETATPNATSLPALPEYEELTDSDLVTSVINALEIGYAKDENAYTVKSNLTLPSVGAEEAAIIWTSSHPAVITPYGGVIRQAEDTTVTLTAEVTHGDVSDTKTFTVTVKAAEEIPVNPNNGQEEEIAVKNSRRYRSTAAEQSGGAAGEAVKQEEPAAPTPEPEKNDTASAETKDTKQFEDIDTVPWAQTAINTLAERGVINGTSDTTYSPQNNIRRADFVILLVKLLGLNSEITDTFEDVTVDSYYYSEVSQAKSLGVISGIDDTHFNPNGYISRQDMMTMSYRALNKLGMADMETDSLDNFNDTSDISDYALESVTHLVGGGYIHGDESGNLNPKANTTRAETAVFLYNLEI